MQVPELFDTKSVNSCQDLVNELSDDSSPQMMMIMKDIVDELDKQEYLTEVKYDVIISMIFVIFSDIFMIYYPLLFFVIHLCECHVLFIRIHFFQQYCMI